MTRDEALILAWHTKRDPETLANLILSVEQETAQRCAQIVDCPHDSSIDNAWDRCRRNQANAIRAQFSLEAS